MKREKLLESLLKRYGKRITLKTGAGKLSCTSAVIQPLGYKNKVYPNDNYLPAGYIDRSSFLYVGPASIRLDLMPDAVIRSGEDNYSIIRAQAKYLASKIVYIWALLELRGDDDIVE